MSRLLYPTALLALLLSGAIFGFFYAWVCSTMWGLDRLEPQIAIAAMQAMNGSVRNAVFAPAFFATPFVLLAAAALAWQQRQGRAVMLFAGAGVIYLVFGLLLTMMVNVPMNEALAAQSPGSAQEAQQIWQAYSPRWQRYNLLRCFASGVSLLLTGMALLTLPRPVSRRRCQNVDGQHIAARS